MGFGLGFDFFGIMFSIVFVLVIGVFVFAAVRMLRTWNKNNRSPRLTVPARVAAKRTEVSHHHHTNAGQDAGFGMTSVTRYYATFEFESGDRMELAVDASEYGLLAEGDVGRRRFLVTSSHAFERIICYWRPASPPLGRGAADGDRRRRKNVYGRIRISCGFCRPAKPVPASMEGAQE